MKPDHAELLRTAKVILLVAEAGEDGWKLYEYRFPRSRNFKLRVWHPGPQQGCVLQAAATGEVRIKVDPDTVWRGLKPGEMVMSGDYTRLKGRWVRLICKPEGEFQSSLEYRTFRPLPA